MPLLFIIIAAFLIGKWIIESMVLAIFKEEKEAKAPPVTHTTIINNHYTENHLHVDKQSFENLKN